MPNRILKESITTSDTLDVLSVEAERFFYRLIVVCDDFGRLDARPRIVRSKCFPLKTESQVSDADVARWTEELRRAELIIVYHVSKRPYLQMVTWLEHQQKRAKFSKYPDPMESDGSLQADDSTCNQLQADDCNSPRETRNENRETRNENDNGVVIDPDLSLMAGAWENAGSMLSKTIADELTELAKENTAAWVVDAIKEAATGGMDKVNVKYIRGILRNWHAKGHKTAAPGNNGSGPRAPEKKPNKIILSDGTTVTP
jgi:DnaD/phage-associated family protein